MSIYSVKIRTQAIEALPSFLRGATVRAWVKVMIWPIDRLKGIFEATRANLVNKTNYTNQRGSLELYLNAIFDNGGTGITIEDGAPVTLYGFQKVETPVQDAVLWLMSEVSAWVYTVNNGTLLISYFVELSTSLWNVLASDPRVRAEVSFFNPAGKLFTIREDGTAGLGLGVKGPGYNASGPLYAGGKAQEGSNIPPPYNIDYKDYFKTLYL